MTIPDVTAPSQLHKIISRVWGPLQHGIALMILSAAAWGTGTVMSKASLDALPPLPLLTVQLTASVIVLWLAVLLGARHSVRSISDLRHGWTGILEPGLAYILGTSGLALTSASSAAVLGVTEPIFIVILALVFLRERVHPAVLAFGVVAVLGTALMSFAGQSEDPSSLLGDLLVLGGTFSAALYVLFSRKSVVHLAPLPLAAAQQTVGLALVLLLLAVSGETLAIASFGALLWAIVTGIIQYALAFFFYLSALRYIPAAVAALFLTLIPVFGLAGASLLLGERLLPLQGIGAVITIGALFASQLVQIKLKA